MLTIYKASAGSGKTFTLAYEYIKDLLGAKDEQGRYTLAALRGEGGHRHRHILAITFTNKATDEMKGRIVHELYDIATRNPDANYTRMLVKEFGCSEDQLAKAAGVALRQILFDFSLFNVSTIDSFFQTVLRTFAREVDKPGNFEVELNDRYAIAMGASMMLNDLNATLTPEATREGAWVKQFMEDKIEQGDGFDLFNRKGTIHSAMVSFINRISHEDFKEKLPEVKEYLDDPVRLDSFRKELLRLIALKDADIKRQAKNIDSELSDAGIDLAEAIEKSRLQRVMTWMTVAPVTDDFKAAGVNALADGNTDKLTRSGKNAVILPPGLADAFVTLFREARQWATDRKIYNLILDGIYYLGFMGYTLNYIDEYRRENNIILLSDTNQLLRTIIGGSEAPFIYERLGTELHHFLVDEFQDTSKMQWDNLFPLVNNSHAEDYDNLVIGDEKQSIYRFRNADSSLLREKVASQFDRVKPRGENPGENTNYRSYPAVVKFNNDLYSAIASSHKVQSYANVVQDTGPKHAGKGGHVVVKVLPSKKKSEYEAMVLPDLAERILEFRGRGYRFGDMAVLVRKRDEAETVVQYLAMEYGGRISVMSDESLLLTSCPTVRLIVSMLRLIQAARRPDTASDVASTSGYASKKEVELMLHRIEFHISNGSTPAEAISLVEKGNPEINELVDYIDSLRSSTLMTLVEHVISTVISKEVRERDKAYVIAFRDCVADYCTRYSNDLHAFLRWWDASSEKLTIPGSDNEDAVRVMTIHKSKGLEMKCVLLPFMNYDMYKSSEEAWYTLEKPIPGIDPSLVPPLLSIPGRKELGDESSPVRGQYLRNVEAQTLDTLNTTYVATTRAVAELVLYTDDSASADCISSWISSSLPPADNIDDIDGGGKTYEYGAPTVYQKKDDDNKKDDKPLTDSPAGFDAVFREDTQDFTRIPDDGEPEYEDDEDAAAGKEIVSPDDLERGNVLHQVLSLVHKASDLEHAFERVAHARRLDSGKRREFIEILRHAFSGSESHELLRGWFHSFSRCVTERPIYVPSEGVNFRPDRVVWLPDGKVQIVDYKFTAHSLPGHHTQVRNYLRLMRQMGYTDAEGYLWYPLSGEIVAVAQ